MSSVRILAPAKVNLGLAILGRRTDGYHDIDTIMAMIDLYDEITVTPTSEPGVSIAGMDHVPVQSNLMTVAARRWSEAAEVDAAWRIEITKRIPSPAGIGGGSSDAAAVLQSLNALADEPLSSAQLHEIAADIGADCPIFLGGPAARATGIGTELRPISPPEGWVVLAIPRIAAKAKTATLYGALTPDDYGTSEDIDQVETRGIHHSALLNSFLEPAMATFAGLSTLHRELSAVAGRAFLSGAGPALFSVAPTELDADNWATQLQSLNMQGVQIIKASFLQSTPLPEIRA